jgi:hypothetical protein
MAQDNLKIKIHVDNDDVLIFFVEGNCQIWELEQIEKSFSYNQKADVPVANGEYEFFVNWQKEEVQYGSGYGDVFVLDGYWMFDEKPIN